MGLFLTTTKDGPREVCSQVAIFVADLLARLRHAPGHERLHLLPLLSEIHRISDE